MLLSARPIPDPSILSSGLPGKILTQRDLLQHLLRYLIPSKTVIPMDIQRLLMLPSLESIFVVYSQ